MDPFVGEIRAFGFTFAPVGWAMCNGQLLPITQNTALFSILGTTYGGDGRSTFGLPNLQGVVPMHFGQGGGLTQRVLGETGGSETVTLLQSQIPAHSHPVGCNTEIGDQYGPPGNLWAEDAAGNNEYAAVPNGSMATSAIGPTGSGLPHDNMQPYVVLNYCISLQGVFPSRS